MLDKITPLSSDERIAARAKAREQIATAHSAAPARESFFVIPVGDYPAWLSTVTAVLLLLIFAAATSLSMFRIYNAAHALVIAHDANATAQATIGGFATIFLAELLMITSVLAARVYFTNWQRWLMLIPAALGGGIALSGNLSTLPTTVFGWLDAITPPIAIMIISLIGERVILTSAKARQEQERKYQEAYAKYKQAESDPEQHPDWPQYRAQAYREAIIAKNARRAAFKAIRDQLNNQHWKVLVNREIRAEDWYTAEQPEDNPLSENVRLGSITTITDGSKAVIDQAAWDAYESTRRTHSANGHTEKE